jgi:putative DNA primase/helicase
MKPHILPIPNGNGHTSGEDRLPPQDLDAERAVLGGLIRDPSWLAGVRRQLTPDDFYRDTHQLVYRILCERADAGLPIDAILLADDLDRRDLFVGLGGLDFLSELLERGSAGFVDHYAAAVRDRARRRGLIEATDLLRRDAYLGRQGPRELAEAFAARLAPLRIAPGDESGPGPVLVRLADVAPEPIRWLWPGRFPLGKVSLLIGDPDLGKSFLTLALASAVSTGAGWPDAPDARREPASVILLSAEDALADTVRPRADAAGADVSRIHALTSVRRADGRLAPFNLRDDLPKLQEALERIGDVRLVVIDPITAYLGDSDEHKNGEIRALLGPLSDLADRFNTTVVPVTHLNKGSGAKAIYRATGSLAFVAAARTAWLVARDRDDPSRRLMLPAKCNIAPDPTGMAYRIVEASVRWEPDPIALRADDALDDGPRAAGADRAAAAADWLILFLADGPRPSDEVLRTGKAIGFGRDSLYRAKDLLEIRARKGGFGAAAAWTWSLPEEVARGGA